MKTLSPLASRLLWTCAVTAILATASITGAQSSDEADAGVAGGRALGGAGGGYGGGAAEGATPESIKTLDQVRQLGSAMFEKLGVELTILNSTPRNPRQMAMKKVTELRAKLKSGEDRAAVESQLRQALSEYFLADMRHRVRELDEIKAKLAETEAKLQRRLDSQQESIDLQLKLFLHEADGLGLFRPEDSLDLLPTVNLGRRPQNDPFNGSLPAGNIGR